MKWSRWIVLSLVSFGALAVNATEPRLSAPRVARVSAISARSAADHLDIAPPMATASRAAITPHAPVHYKLASWDIWGGTSTGYVYAPGACDYTPPCVNHLWDGYVQRPLRCYGPHMHHHHCRLPGCGACGGSGCGVFAGCDTCGSASSCGCGGHSSLLKRAHGWHFGGRIYSGCSSCGSIAPSCGCDGIGGKSDDDAPAPAPAPAPKDAAAPRVPMPTADGDLPEFEFPPEKAARGKRLRGFTWPESSLQR